MKKVLSVLLALLMVFGLLAPMASAADIELYSSITIDQTGPINLTVGGTYQLTSNPASTSAPPATDAVWWMSSDANIAGIGAYTGFVTAVAPGSVVMTVTDNSTGDIATITVNVAAATPAPTITLAPTSLVLTAGGTASTITATVNDYAGPVTLTWASSNPAVASVSNTGVVTPLTAGASSITASATINSTSVTSDPVTVNVTGGATPVITPSLANTPVPLLTTRNLTATVSNVATQPTISWQLLIATWIPDDGIQNLTNGPSLAGNILFAGQRPGWISVQASVATPTGVAPVTQQIRIGPQNIVHVPATTRAAIPVNTFRFLEASVPGLPTANIRWDVISTTLGFGQSAVSRRMPSASQDMFGRWVLDAGNRLGSVTLRASVIGNPAIFEQFTVSIISAHTVTFNLNGGTWPVSGLVQSTGSTFEQAINAVQVNGAPRRLNFVFAGWWTTPAIGGTQVFGNTLVGANTTLWARWSLASNTTAVPAGSSISTIFPDQNLATRVAASLGTTFNTPVTVNTRVFASDLATIQVLNLTRFTNQPITDLRGIPTLTGVRTVTPSNGLTNQNITLPSVPRTSPLNHTNVVRNRDGGFVNPTAISNNGAIQTTLPANSTIRWASVPAQVSSLNYTWNVPSVLIGNQTVSFSGTATLPIRGTSNFIDVNSSHWFFNAVNFVVEHGYMEGTTVVTFEPNRALTRAEVAVILYRMAGEPVVTGVPPFTDVTAAWQRNAIIWASRNDIVQGIGGNRFAPDRTVTRQEFAAMLHRFTAFNGVSVSVPGTANLNRFPDRADVSNWAVGYMTWATHRGLITGTSGGRLNPLGTTTRAECAQIIQRYATTIIW